MNKLILFLLLLSLFFCSKKKPIPESAVYDYNFTMWFAAEMHRKYDLQIRVQGGSYYVLRTHFNSPKICYTDEARKLIFAVANDCLSMLNSDPRMKTIMQKRPHDPNKKPNWGSDTDFDYSNLGIIIGFVEVNEIYSPPNIAFISINANGVCYFITDHGKDRHEVLFQESIDVALEKLKTSEKTSISQIKS